MDRRQERPQYRGNQSYGTSPRSQGHGRRRADWQNNNDRAPKRRNAYPRDEGRDAGERRPVARPVYRFDAETIAKALPLSQRPRTKSLWDVPAKGYERISAEQLKLSGAFTPGMDLSSDKIPPQLLDIINVSPLTPNNSILMRKLIVTPSDPTEYLTSLYSRAGVDTKPEEIDIQQQNEKYIVTLPSAKHSALFMAIPGDFAITRVPGVITTTFGSIYSNSKTKFITNLPEDVTAEAVKKLYPTMTSRAILINSTEGKCMGSAFALFDNGMPDSSNVFELFPDKLSAASELSSDATNVSDFVALANNFSTYQSTVLQLLNVVNEDDLRNPQTIEALKESIDEQCTTFGEVVSIRVLNTKGQLPRVLIKFATAEACTAALESLGGLLFDNRPVITAFYDESTYDQTL